MRIKTTLLMLVLALAAPAWSAINPAEFQRAASDVLRIRESARIVQETDVDGVRLRRVTLVGEVIEIAESRRPLLGKTVVIDYSVNLTQRAQAAQAHAARNGQRPGPQFMHEPDPPVLDEEGAYWANLAPAGDTQARASRYAGAGVGQASNDISGEVFVPVAGQYSFDRPPR